MPRALRLPLLALLLQLQLALSARVTSPKKVPKNAVLLSKVSSLTVRGGQKTASRRVSPVPQLQCVGSPEVCKLYSVDVMRCTNEGSDYDAESIQWACKASLPDEFKLGSTDVSCEGYESSDDPYILKGSCGVEYKLLLTEQGEAKYGKASDYSWPSGRTKSSETYAGYLFMAVFLIVLFIILRSLYQAWQRDDPRGGGPRLGGGGWGGGPDDDPPPPYDDNYSPHKKRAYAPRTSTGTRASSSRANAGNQQQGWRPGFWTGTAAGAGAGYLAGNRGQARTQPETVERRPGGGLFGGGGGSGSGTRQPPSGPSSSTPSFSSSRHESTGFGSTSRR